MTGQACPQLLNTEAQKNAVLRGHHRTVENALMGQVYTLVRRDDSFIRDTSSRPMTVSYSVHDECEELSSESDDPEAETGTVYILNTGTFTREGKEILKIGVTTQSIEQRLQQLYTTGVPFQFSVLKTWTTKGHYELERALHKLLDPFRLAQSREFFTSDCLAFVEKIAELHAEILKSA